MPERFKELRKVLGLTQVQLGELIGVSGPAIARIEAGQSNPTEAALRLICARYHVSYTWLTTGAGEMMEAMDTDALIEKYMPNESEFTKSIMKSFARLPDSEWERLRDLIEKIKRESRS